MPWYYAGPEAKPVGPVTLEELHAHRLRGLITPDTYVIEHTGGPEGVAGSWRHYQDVFPERVNPTILPPLPGSFSMPPQLPPPVSHPLFPSASPTPQPASYVPAAGPHPGYPMRRTNSACAWGFGLGMAGFILSPFCGLGLLLAAPALIICILGFAQVHRRNDQSGRGLATAGAVLAVLGLVVSLGILAWAIPTALRERHLIIEQSSTTTE